jgi:hypothetical protein
MLIFLDYSFIIIIITTIASLFNFNLKLNSKYIKKFIYIYIYPYNILVKCTRCDARPTYLLGVAGTAYASN